MSGIEAAIDGLLGILTMKSLAFMTLGVLIGSVVGFLPGVG